LYFTSGGVTMSLVGAGSVEDTRLGAHDLVRMRFLGANQEACLQEEEPLPGKVNYLLGNDPSKWHTDLPTYKGIRYSSLYPGVSLTYSGEARRLKGIYTISPGADPGVIKWRYEGASGVKVDPDGNL